MDSLSYSLGVLITHNLKQQGFENLVAEDLNAAINDVLSGKPLKIELEAANDLVQKHAAEQAAKAQAGMMQAGVDYLAENGQRDGVTTTVSGLQYEVLTEGTGPKPSATDKVTVHYHGTLIDGTVFDSSVARNSPATFPLNQVIPGWTEGVQLMSVGSKYRFVIPYDLAYGDRGAGAQIKPYSTLIFEVELLSIG